MSLEIVSYQREKGDTEYHILYRFGKNKRDKIDVVIRSDNFSEDKK